MTGCLNMPTDPSEITGTHVSHLKYDQYDCPTLVAEANSLARREALLVTAQTNRMKRSHQQAFWVGYGKGDGIEAAELAILRGEKEAVLKAMDSKECPGTGS